MTLYEALTGKFPFGEIEPFQNPSFDKNPKHPTKYNAKIPDWLESIVLRAVETDTNKRYHNYSEMFYEMNNPVKVKPYFDKNLSFIQRNEKKVLKKAKPLKSSAKSVVIKRGLMRVDLCEFSSFNVEVIH